MSTAQILVVEDERLVAKAIKNELEHFGYGVSGIASSANEAMRRAGESPPDLVLMDIQLQGNGDGIEAARRIHDRWGIPVIYLSAYSDASTLARATDTGAFGYLIKPYEERELQTTIEMALAKHRAEQKLAETERWLEAIQASIGDGIIATDADNYIRVTNFAAELLTGWRHGSAVGKRIADVCKFKDEMSGHAFDELSKRVMREGCTLELPTPTWLVAKDGSETPIEGNLAPIPDSHGGFLGTALVLRNISARLEAEQLRDQVEQRQRRAQKMEAISRLAGGLSHRLNGLLGKILGNTSLAIATWSQETSKLGVVELLRDVENAAQNAAQLSQRLHLLSLFSRRPLTDIEPVDLNMIIPDCMGDIQSLLDPQIKIAFKASATPWLVVADELLVGQALIELALNSQQAMPHGGQVTISLDRAVFSAADLDKHPAARAGEFVRVRVEDNGTGMEPDLRDKLFQTFSKSLVAHHVSGLGLMLVSTIIEQHEGWVECSSQKDRGTRIDLFLPRAGAPETIPAMSTIVQQQP